MADTYTPHYNLTKPEIGGDPDTWGNLLNANMDAIDTAIYNAQTTANAALPLAGGTMTGLLTANAGITVAGGQVLLPNGASTAPSLSFSSDGAHDTGFYWGGDGVIAIASQGALIATFSPTGLTLVGSSAGIAASGNISTSATGSFGALSVAGGATFGTAITTHGRNVVANNGSAAGEVQILAPNGSSSMYLQGRAGGGLNFVNNGYSTDVVIIEDNGAIHSNADIYATGNLHAGSANFQTDGNITGASVWGGALSTYLVNTFAGHGAQSSNYGSTVDFGALSNYGGSAAIGSPYVVVGVPAQQGTGSVAGAIHIIGAVCTVS